MEEKRGGKFRETLRPAEAIGVLARRLGKTEEELRR